MEFCIFDDSEQDIIRNKLKKKSPYKKCIV